MNSVLAVDPRRNAKLCWMKHPRFGATRCVRSIRSIQKGEEILVDYGYNTTDSYCPRYKKILYWQETVKLQRDRCSVSSNKAFNGRFFCFCSFSECADTEQLEWQVLRARYLGSIFDFTSSQMWESNQGWLGEKRERFLCAMPSPNIYGR